MESSRTSTRQAPVRLQVRFGCEAVMYSCVLFFVTKPRSRIFTGIVGAGGNVGAVCFSVAFRQTDYTSAFVIMGAIIMGSSLFSVLVNIKGHAGLICGKDANTDKECKRVVPEPTVDGQGESSSEEDAESAAVPDR